MVRWFGLGQRPPECFHKWTLITLLGPGTLASICVCPAGEEDSHGRQRQPTVQPKQEGEARGQRAGKVPW